MFGTLDFTEFRVLLEALKENSESKLVSSPSITASENRESRIHVGEVVPIPQFVRNEQFGTTSTSGYVEVEVGTSLRVTPRINRDDTISMVITPEVSAIIGFTGPENEYPIRTKREAETEVTLLPGRTLVIGGLVSENTIEVVSKLPSSETFPWWASSSPTGAMIKRKPISLSSSPLTSWISNPTPCEVMG